MTTQPLARAGISLLALTLAVSGVGARAQDSDLSLGDRVWFDNDRNGVQDSYDSGLAGVAVNLYAADELIGRAITDEAGGYLFTSTPGEDTDSVRYGIPLSPDTPYELRLSPLETELYGYAPAFTGQGTPETDSDGVLVESQITAATTLTPDTPENLSLDFGFRSGNFSENIVDLPDSAVCPIPGLEEFLVEDAECGGFGGAGPEEEEEEVEEEPVVAVGGVGDESEIVAEKVVTRLIRTGGVD